MPKQALCKGRASILRKETAAKKENVNRESKKLDFFSFAAAFDRSLQIGKSHKQARV